MKGINEGRDPRCRLNRFPTKEDAQVWAFEWLTFPTEAKHCPICFAWHNYPVDTTVTKEKT